MTHLPILRTARPRRAHRRRRRLRIAEEVLKHKSVKRADAGRDRRVGGRVRQAAFPGIHRAGVQGQALRTASSATAWRSWPRPTAGSTSSSSTRPIRKGRAPCCSPRRSTPRCKRCLTKGGVLVTQNGVPMFQPAELTATHRQASARCSRTRPATVAAIPTYVGGFMAMGFATDNKTLRQTSERTIAARYRKAGRFHDQILDAGGAPGGVRAAALHRRAGRRGQALELACHRCPRPRTASGALLGQPSTFRISSAVMRTDCSRQCVFGARGRRLEIDPVRTVGRGTVVDDLDAGRRNCATASSRDLSYGIRMKTKSLPRCAPRRASA